MRSSPRFSQAVIASSYDSPTTAFFSRRPPATLGKRATLSVAASVITLKRPDPQPKTLPASLSLHVVRVWESVTPQGEEPIEWYLYTSEPIETTEQQLLVVDYYRARWVIEEYNKAIKTGCDFEKRQLQDYDALINLLAVFLPIAYRLLLLRTEAARAPEQPALNVVSQDEIDVLRVLGRRKLPESPSAQDVYLAIAELGGYIKYKKSPPGWLTLTRGFEELQTLVTGWRAAKLQLRSDQP